MIEAQNQRAIMAHLPSALAGGAPAVISQCSRGGAKVPRHSPYLSAGKVGLIEKIGLTGKFCQAGRTAAGAAGLGDRAV